MTLEELLQIIRNKRENAKIDLKCQKGYYGKTKELKGAIDTYTDLICLIESELNKEKK